jgi:hypothetical protein
VWFQQGRSELQPKLVERQITDNPPEDFVMDGAISPNGETLAYLGPNGLYFRSMNSGETRPAALPAEFQEHIGA